MFHYNLSLYELPSENKVLLFFLFYFFIFINIDITESATYSIWCSVIERLSPEEQTTGIV